MTRVQRCSGLAGSASAGSSTAGNEPPAVRGPLDAENSVDTIRPVDGQRRTLPAVAAIAASVSSCSRDVALVDDAETRQPAPP